MSGSGGNEVTVSWTADTSSFDTAMAASATAAKAAFDQVGTAGTTAGTAVTASLAQMQKSLAAAQAQFVALGPAAQGAIQQVITSLEQQIAAATASAAASKAANSAIADSNAVVFTSLQQNIDAMMGLDRQMASASASAKAFTSALSMQGVAASEAAAEQRRLDAALSGSRMQMLSTASGSRALAAETALLGSKVQTVSGSQFFGMFERQFPGIRTGLLSAADSAKVFEAEMGSAGVAAGQMGNMTAGATREMIVLGREAMSGNFSRMPGSFMVLASRMGNVTSGFLAMAAGLGIAAFAAADLVEWLHRVQTAQRQISAAGAFFNPQLNEAALNKIEADLAKLPEMTHKMAAEVVGEFARMPGQTAPLLDALSQNIQTFADAMGTTAPAAAKTLAAAFGEPTARGREFMSQINASAEAMKAFDTATDASGRRQVMLATYEAQLTRALNTTQASLKREQDELWEATKRVAELGGAEALSAASTAQFSAQVNSVHTERSIAAINALKSAILSLNNLERTPGSGMASWAAKHEETLLEIQNKAAASAKTRRGMEEASSKAAANFWAQAAKEEGITDAQRTQAMANANRARLTLMKEEASGAAAGAKQGLMAQIAAISAQQAAVKNDYNQWKSLQEQKLTVIRGAVGEQTALYQNALREMNAAERAHNDQASSQGLAALRNQETVDRMALSTRKATLDAMVAANQMSKSQELQELKNLATQQDNANMETLNNLIKTLQEGTAQYAQAMNMRRTLTAQLVMDTEKYNAAILKADAKAATGAEKAWTTAFDKIGTSFESEVSSYISGQQTMAQAAQNVITSIISSVATGAIKMAASWAASELAMRTASITTQNAVAASQAAGGTGFAALITKQLAQWVGLETTKTTTAATGSAARSAIATAETAKDNASFLVRAGRWIASELGITAASTTASAARVATSAAADTATMAEDKVTKSGEISSAAGVAAANAFAATAAIPIVGPELAPAAAAAAFAQVEAYQGSIMYEAGTMNVPRTESALVHKGEMIVPATFATGLRSALGAGGSGSPGNNVHMAYSPTISVDGGGSGSSYGQISALLSKSQGQMMQYMWNMTRNGNLTLPMRGLS